MNKKDKKEKTEKSRSNKIQILLFILGFLTAGLGWILLIIYRLMRPKKIKKVYVDETREGDEKDDEE